jgi:hypothetical protein
MVTVNRILFPVDCRSSRPMPQSLGYMRFCTFHRFIPVPSAGKSLQGVRQFSTRQSGDDRRLRPSVCSTSLVETSRAASTTRFSVVANATR